LGVYPIHSDRIWTLSDGHTGRIRPVTIRYEGVMSMGLNGSVAESPVGRRIVHYDGQAFESTHPHG